MSLSSSCTSACQAALPCVASWSSSASELQLTIGQRRIAGQSAQRGGRLRPKDTVGVQDALLARESQFGALLAGWRLRMYQPAPASGPARIRVSSSTRTMPPPATPPTVKPGEHQQRDPAGADQQPDAERASAVHASVEPAAAATAASAAAPAAAAPRTAAATLGQRARGGIEQVGESVTPALRTARTRGTDRRRHRTPPPALPSPYPPPPPYQPPGKKMIGPGPAWPAYTIGA